MPRRTRPVPPPPSSAAARTVRPAPPPPRPRLPVSDPPEGGRRGPWLRIAAVAGPAGWALAFWGNVFLVRAACAGWAVPLRYAALVPAALAAAVGLVAAWRLVALVRSHPPGAPGSLGRDRFFVLASFGWNGITVILIVALLATLLVLDPCLRDLGGPRWWRPLHVLP